MAEWAVELRPKTLNQMIGQEANIEILQKWVDTKTLPNALIFYGRSGSGKTTAGRILPLLMGAELIELDAASHNSVDDARQINEQALRMSLTGRDKIFLIDECFTENTLISTPSGAKKIKDIKPGDTVTTLEGMSKVTNTICKQVAIDKLLVVTTSKGNKIEVTSNHLFFTNRGWIAASKLNKGDLLYESSMSNMWGDSIERRPKDLLKEVRSYLAETYQTTDKICDSDLRNLREGIPAEILRKNKDLFNAAQELFDRINAIRKSTTRKPKTVYEREQPDAQPRSSSKNETYKNTKRDVPFTTSSEGREWAYNKVAAIIVRELTGHWGDFGISNSDRLKSTIEEWLSDLLQSGYWATSGKDCDRGRWRRSLTEIISAIRYEEGEQNSRVWVEDIKSYEQGDRGGLTGNTSENTDYIAVYDLEIEGHPSYFAEDVLVHNCHMLSQAAWNSLLKVIEEPNPKVHFIFATTEYTKLPLTIRGRSRMLKFYSIPKEQLKEYAEAVLEHKGYKLSEEVIDLAVDQSNGQVRDLLKILQTAAEGNFTPEKFKKFFAIPDDTGMRNFINAVLTGSKKNGLKVLNSVSTDLLEWVTGLQKHIYRLLEHKYAVTPMNFGDNITLANKVETLIGKFSDQQFGALLTELNKINNAQTAYANLYALLFRGIM